MTICFFGNYITDYPRVATLRQGLKLNNIEVIECQTRKTGFKKYFDLYQQHRKIKNNYDILLVAMGGYTLVWLAKVLSSKKIIFDAFTSNYLTNVEDRKNCPPRSLKAYYYKFLDKFSCQLADVIILDTEAQINYFVGKFNLPKNKFQKLFISADDKIYFPQKYQKENDKFIIHWHGHIVPFHSLETIISAANILSQQSDIEFQIVTRFSSQYEKIRKMVENLKLKNIKFYPETDYAGLANYINNSDVCLGIFGDNPKAQVVIPNKIIEALACAKPVITANQQVLAELFQDQESIILVQPENPADLAEKILFLKNNLKITELVAHQGYQLYLKKLTPDKIAQHFLSNIIKKLIN